MSATDQEQPAKPATSATPLFGSTFDARFWLNRRTSGYIGALLTWFLVLFELSVLVGIVVCPWLGFSRVGVANIAFAVMICLLALVAHGKAMLTDPGAVPRGPLPATLAEPSLGEIDRIDVKALGLCGRCRQFKPKRAHHCSRCGRCVVKMDHHCVWVNNCVGIGNTKFFILFNAYILTLTVYTLGITALWWWKATHSSTRVEIALVLLAVTAAVVFGFFTASILEDQIGVLRTGLTLIDRRKSATQTDIASGVDVFYEVFGGESAEFALTWLLPTDVWFLPSLKPRILGYVLEEELEGLRRRWVQAAANTSADRLAGDSFRAEGECSPPCFTPIDALSGAGWAIEKLAADGQVSDWCVV